MQLIRNWFKRHFSDPQVVILAVILVALFLFVYVLGNILAPVFAAFILAYLLEGMAVRMEKLKIPRMASILVVFLVFLTFLFIIFFGLLPFLSQQVFQFAQQLPSMINRGNQELMRLPETYPEYISVEQVNEFIAFIRSETGPMGQRMLTLSFASFMNLIELLIYLILLPLLVFFFLKDKELIISWFKRFLPANRTLANVVWKDVNQQITNYVRGKFWEIMIVWIFSYITFTLFDLQYTPLISFLVGISVLVPYLGAMFMAIPIALIGFFQWGLDPKLAWALVAYAIIQALDGNLLAPLLLSEVTSLHPIAIIVAVLVFGSWWGFWGVFFAIPMATLIHAVLRAWPRQNPDDIPKEA